MFQNILQKGLLGMGGISGTSPQPQGLLGDYYDPNAARMATLKNMLIMGGLGFAGDGMQGAARGAGLAAMETPRQFRDMAMDAYQMDRQSKEDEWRNSEREREIMDRQNREVMMNGMDPKLRQYYELGGPGLASQYIQATDPTFRGPPEPPKVETFFDEETGQQYKAQWDNQAGRWIPVGGRKAGENGITIGPDGTVQIGGQKTTEGDRRAILLANQSISQEPTIMSTFDSMATARNTIGANENVPGGRYFMTPEGQAAQDALSNVIGNWLYLTSGATAPAEEVRKRTAEVTPTALDSPKVVQLKRARLKSIFDGMRQRAGIPIPQDGQTLPESGGGVDPLAEARAAIAAGADPNAVKQRLQQMGIDPSGL